MFRARRMAAGGQPAYPPRVDNDELHISQPLQHHGLARLSITARDEERETSGAGLPQVLSVEFGSYGYSLVMNNINKDSTYKTGSVSRRQTKDGTYIRCVDACGFESSSGC